MKIIGGRGMKQYLNILIIVCILLATASLKAEDKSLPESQGKFDIDELDKMRYRDFIEIETFNKLLTRVYYMGGAGDDATKAGLYLDELTDYLRLKIKNKFANIRIEIPDFDKYTEKQVGLIKLEVWFLGDSNPMVFHIKCEFWNNFFEGNYQLWNREMLGFGSLAAVNDSVKESIDRLIEDLAFLFFKVRGEL